MPPNTANLTSRARFSSRGQARLAPGGARPHRTGRDTCRVSSSHALGRGRYVSCKASTNSDRSVIARTPRVCSTGKAVKGRGSGPPELVAVRLLLGFYACLTREC
jgi:hypothetical protein